MRKKIICKELKRIYQGLPHNRKMYEHCKRRISKKIVSYQKEKDRLKTELKAMDNPDPKKQRAYNNSIEIMDAMIIDLNNLLNYDIKLFYMRLYRSPWLV